MPLTTFHRVLKSLTVGALYERPGRSQTAPAVILIALLLSACTQNMANQPRYDTLESSDFFPNGSSARLLPLGVVPHDFAATRDLLGTGLINGKPADQFPMPLDIGLLRRGRQRYNIYCSPCHDYVGTGNGMAAIRGFQRKPPSFHIDSLRIAPAGHFFDVITNGFGSMPQYANQIPVTDRWAIIAYVRALQLSQWTAIAEVPEDARRRLESEKEK